jgi:hypothetical protein
LGYPIVGIVSDGQVSIRQAFESIAKTLDPDVDKTNETVEWEMAHLLDWLKQNYTEEDDAALVDNVIRYSRGFGQFRRPYKSFSRTELLCCQLARILR